MVAKVIQPACVLTEGSWADFGDDVKKVEPELFEIIEQISPDQRYKLIKAQYLYGEQITNLGTICVPDKVGRLARLDDPNVSNDLKDQFGYCPTPLILQLSNASEVYVDAEGRIVPLNVFYPGDLYGLYEVLVPFTGCPAVPCWSITSGCRSVFFAAKVSESIGHKNLRAQFIVPSSPPNKLEDEWSVIKGIANRGLMDAGWKSEILIFTKNWFEKKENDINWLRFQNYLFKKSWWQSRSNRIQVEYSIMWETFAKAVCAQNLKPNSYIVDTVKHLMQLAAGTGPGFRIADENDTVLPTRLIEEAYVNCYGLKDYAPIIMHPHILGARNDPSSIYYSMAYPTLLVGTPAIRKTSNIMAEIRDVKNLMTTLERVLGSYEERIYETMKKVKFEYFHSDNDRFGEIMNSRDIAEIDPIISAALDTRFKDKQFSSYGPFFRGCIRVSKLESYTPQH